MRDHTYTPFFIISAERDGDNNLTRNIATSNLEYVLRKSGHRFSEITGCYKGSKETSFIVYANNKDLALELAKRYKQDCVLIRNGHNDCVLWFSDGKQEFIGHFKQVPEKEALEQDAYSLIDGDFYIISKDR